MHLPFQKVKKNIVWGSYIDWDNIHFFFRFIWTAHTFLLAGNQFIFCKEVVATHVQCGMLQTS